MDEPIYFVRNTCRGDVNFVVSIAANNPYCRVANRIYFSIVIKEKFVVPAHTLISGHVANR
jgi:hypothetical protein